jgi:hypothetical protein
LEGSLRVARHRTGAGHSAAANSAHRFEDFGIGGKTANRLLGTDDAAIDADLKDAATRSLQCYLGIWSGLANQLRRLTGARFVTSLATIVDLDMHDLRSSFWGGHSTGMMPPSPSYSRPERGTDREPKVTPLREQRAGQSRARRRRRIRCQLEHIGGDGQASPTYQ